MRKSKGTKKRISRRGMAIFLTVIITFSNMNISAFAQGTEVSVSKVEENAEEITTEMSSETISGG